MLKRILAWLLCLLLITAALPMSVLADESEEETAEETVQEPDPEAELICQQITSNYWRTVRYSGRSNLAGYCGLMAGWELYFMGVTSYPITQNGNQMYDIFSRMEQTDKGYDVKAYSAGQYTLEEALNTVTNCATQDAYNLMVGFQRTTTAAGRIYGHVCVIYAILDGVVYFTEGFATPFNSIPSKPMICTIEEFADYYGKWTTFEGLVEFGRKDYTDFCTSYGANLFVSSDHAVTTMTQPGGEYVGYGRTAAPGERLHAVGVYQTPDGGVYYRIDDCGTVCYVPAEAVEVVQFAYDDVTAVGIELPELVAPGSDVELTGTVTGVYNRINRLIVEIIDANGQVVLSSEIEKDSHMVDLSHRSVNTRVDISSLPEGVYTYNIYAGVANYYGVGGMAVAGMELVSLVSKSFTVGNQVLHSQETDVAAFSRTVENGWVYEQGCWYYYENGTARTGWFCDGGVDYYLQSDGSAATGWQEINGKLRYFTATGAMRIGWLEVDGGKYYMLSNGVPAVGLKQIGRDLYCFGEDGRLLTECAYSAGNVSYYINASGVAIIQE